MSVKVESTTDTQEAVLAATGGQMEKTGDQLVEEGELSASAEEQDETAENSEDSEQLEAKEDGDEESEEKEVQDKPKAKGGFKKKIDKLTSKLSAKEQEAEYWRNRALAQSAPEPQGDESAKKIEATGAPSPDDFDTQAEYIQAITEWNLNKREAKKQADDKAAQTLAAKEALVEKYKTQAEALATQHEDYDEVMEGADDIIVPPTIQQMILESEVGAQLAYEFAKNKDEFAKICALPDLQAAKEFGKFEDRVLKAEPKQKPVEAKTTKAPKPITPVGGKSAGAIAKSPDEMNFQEFKKWREANI